MSSFHRVAQDWQHAQGMPSFSVAVVPSGTPLYTAGFGNATPATIYQTASLGKHFTAALALLLASSGEGPSLDAEVAAHLPELPKPWSAITLRHLLSHTAGIPEAGYNSLDQSRDYTDPEIVHAISSPGSPDFPAGTSWSYSNAGYVLAGIALGRAMGCFYGDLLHDRIFAPLGMTTAAVNAPGAPVGYVREKGIWVPAAFVSPSLNRLADGGICISVLDLIRWESALSGDWGKQVAEMFVETEPVGPDSSGAGLQSRLNPVSGDKATGYGLGWFLSDHGRVAEHDGYWQGFSTAMIRHLDQGLSAIVLANRADCDVAALANALLAAARHPHT